MALRDFTERLRAERALRENEARLRRIADASPSMLWSAAPDGAITWASDSWYRYTGLDQKAGVPDWVEFLHPDDSDRWLAAWTAVQRRFEFEVEVRKRRHDGHYRWFIKRAAPQRDASGRVVAWFGSTTDIDDLKRAEQAVRESESLFRAVFNQQFQFRPSCRRTAWSAPATTPSSPPRAWPARPCSADASGTRPGGPECRRSSSGGRRLSEPPW
jgi:PAS domain S-box-containing protein